MTKNQRPLCFVLMPFGIKKDPGGGPDIDFDRIYEQGIRPGIEAADMDPIRADEERLGGIIHKAMFERLLLCDYAVADLTTANANVFYELGVRHAVRPATTIATFATSQKIPFDVNFLRALPYDLGSRNRFGGEEGKKLKFVLSNRLQGLRREAERGPTVDSPLFQLLNGYEAPDIARLKTDIFRDQVQYAVDIKNQLTEARDRRDANTLFRIEKELEPFDSVEAGVLVDLLLSYRALQDWDRMIDLYQKLPAVLQRSVLVREQFGFALNRTGNRTQALRVLEGIVYEQGPSSETCGLIGRVYKDQWVEQTHEGDELTARGFLDKAIDAYVAGFEADWRDAYPGINAVTLLDIRGDDASLQQKSELLPVVRFAVIQRIRSSSPDYWDYATLLELAVLDNDSVTAKQHLGSALSSVREPWEPATTANNLHLIRDARSRRSRTEDWLGEIIAALERTAD